MTDIQGSTNPLADLTQWEEVLRERTQAIRETMAHAWLDIHRGKHIQDTTRHELLTALNHMRTWCYAIQGLLIDEEDPILQECPYCHNMHISHLIELCPFNPLKQTHNENHRATDKDKDTTSVTVPD